MEKDQKTKVVAVFALCIAILGLTIGFASFSTNLVINGTGTVKSSNWEVRFENLQAVQLTGNAGEVTAPIINTNDTNIGDYDVTLNAPGDSVSYTFDIANNGTFDATITSVSIPTPRCTGTGDNATVDATNVCNNITYSLNYSDGGAVNVGDTLASKEKKTVKLTLAYKDTVTADVLPSNDVTVENLGISMIYSQD